MRLGDDSFNGKLHGLDDKVDSSFDANCKIDWEKPLCKAGDGILGDMGCNDTSESRWDAERT